jgi:hypothetical protein
MSAHGTSSTSQRGDPWGVILCAHHGLHPQEPKTPANTGNLNAESG